MENASPLVCLFIFIIQVESLTWEFTFLSQQWVSFHCFSVMVLGLHCTYFLFSLHVPLKNAFRGLTSGKLICILINSFQLVTGKVVSYMYNSGVIMFVMSISFTLHTRLFWNYSPDYSLIFTPLSPITITYYYYYYNCWGSCFV